MANVAAGKAIVEKNIKAPEVVTNGSISGYSGYKGFAHFNWPNTITVDLESAHNLFCIRFLLWDNLGKPGKQRSERQYLYRVLTSMDLSTWDVLYVTGSNGYNGWQVFHLPKGLKARYVRIHGLYNSAKPHFHVVEIEAHDSEPPLLNAEIVLEKSVSNITTTEEVREELPLEAKVNDVIVRIENLIDAEESKILNLTPLRELVAKLRMQVKDISVVSHSMESIRREIISPVKKELDKTAKIGKFSIGGFWVGLIGGVIGIISIIINLLN